jgi:hypothetical protein
MWHRVGLVKTGVSEKCIASIFRVKTSASEEIRIRRKTPFFARGFSYTEDGGDFPLKRRSLQDTHGATFHKTTLFTVTTVRTSNPTLYAMITLFKLSFASLEVDRKGTAPLTDRWHVFVLWSHSATWTITTALYIPVWLQETFTMKHLRTNENRAKKTSTGCIATIIKCIKCIKMYRMCSTATWFFLFSFANLQSTLRWSNK